MPFGTHDIKLQVQNSKGDWGTLQEERNILDSELPKTRKDYESRLSGWQSNCDRYKNANFRILIDNVETRGVVS